MTISAAGTSGMEICAAPMRSRPNLPGSAQHPGGTALLLHPALARGGFSPGPLAPGSRGPRDSASTARQKVLPGPGTATPRHNHRSSGGPGDSSNPSVPSCGGCSARQPPLQVLPRWGSPRPPLCILGRQMGDRAMPTAACLPGVESSPGKCPRAGMTLEEQVWVQDSTTELGDLLSHPTRLCPHHHPPHPLLAHKMCTKDRRRTRDALESLYEPTTEHEMLLVIQSPSARGSFPSASATWCG